MQYISGSSKSLIFLLFGLMLSNIFCLSQNLQHHKDNAFQNNHTKNHDLSLSLHKRSNPSSAMHT